MAKKPDNVPIPTSHIFRVTATIDGKRRMLIVRATSRFGARQAVLRCGSSVRVHKIKPL